MLYFYFVFCLDNFVPELRRPLLQRPLLLRTIILGFNEDDLCSICLQPKAAGEEVGVITLCEHTFHKQCIEDWFEINNRCPICRAGV